MVDFLNDDIVFKGIVTASGELVANGGLTIGPGGVRVGDPGANPLTSWSAHVRARVANIAERDALTAWRTSHTPISTQRPLAVWRADGSSTGLDEITIDGVNWYAESASAGDVELTISDAAGYGWILMQGQILTNAQALYPALWAAASPSLRTGGTDLRIPDMRGRSPMGSGQGPGLTLRNMGDQFGGETATISAQQLPPHSHSGNTGGLDRGLNHKHHWASGHDNGGEVSGSGYQHETHGGAPEMITHATSYVAELADSRTDGNLQHAHPFTSDNGPGQGAGHANIHPVTVVNYKLKV